jgi:hypothetical protein
MEAMTLIGMSRLERESDGRIEHPPIISKIYKILRERDVWTRLKALMQDIGISELGNVGEVDESHWWAHPGAEIRRGPYTAMAASFLASAEEVSSF